MPNRILAICLSTFVFVVTLGIHLATAEPTVSSRLTLQALGARDQDDITFWLHPTDLSQSTIIASDKSANRLFVYDLNGNPLQVIAAQNPGNIDARYAFPLGGKLVDIVTFNERNTKKIRVFKVDPSTRGLVQIDDGNINSGPSYGFTLYKSPTTGRFYAFTGPQSKTRVKQFELVDAGNGRVSAVGPLRQLQRLGTVEGMVADDEKSTLYLAEESRGLWKFDAEPDGATSGTKIASVGQNGLTADVEGVTIYYMPNGQGYIIASSQGNSTFKVYERKSPHNFVGTFKISGVMSTDGVDVINLPLNADFARGIFASHNGRTSPFPVQIVKWEDIATALHLSIDTQYWDPRKGIRTKTAAVAAAGTANASGKAGNSASATVGGINIDRTPLTVAAALVAVGEVEDEEGRFRVQVGCSDNFNANVTIAAEVNGIPVINGQVLKLKVDDETRAKKVKKGRRILKIKAPVFHLVVACRDAAGNVDTAIALPPFAMIRRGG